MIFIQGYLYYSSPHLIRPSILQLKSDFLRGIAYLDWGYFVVFFYLIVSESDLMTGIAFSWEWPFKRRSDCIRMNVFVNDVIHTGYNSYIQERFSIKIVAFFHNWQHSFLCLVFLITQIT